MLRLMRSLVFATCATIAITAPVMADAFGVGPPNAGWFADNATHTYCWGGGFNVALQNNAEYAMSVSLGNGTDITESFQGYNCTLATDVVWFDADLPEGVRGQYVCADFIGGDVCGQSTVTLDPVFLNQRRGGHDEDRLSRGRPFRGTHSQRDRDRLHAERRGPERRCPMAPVQSAPQGPHQWPLLGTSRAAE